ncbi:MAG: hypothetical protein U0946_04900 [Patescibacteria group bacterium]|nr:hypothetical protein [Patescibacteria group bacterium]
MIKNITVITIITIITVILKAPAKVSAQTISLSIWPPLLEAVIQPGKAITQVFKLKNLGDDTIINASIVPFEPADAFGNISLSQTASPALSFFSLQNADLKLPAAIPLKSGQTQEFVLKIKVPEIAAEADHYFAFLFSANTKGLISATGTKTLGSIAANILLTVSQTGDLRPTAKIEKFSVTGSGPVSVLDSFDPINFHLLLTNTSSTRLKAVGQIEVKNTFNRLVATLPLREDNILAHSSRYLTSDPWNPIFPIGRYTATATITPQNTVNQISQTIHFYVLPYKALLLIITLLTIIIKLVHNKSK